MTDVKNYVNSLFSQYEQTDALGDFKEELEANMDAKISSFIKNGMNKIDAFERAKNDLDGVRNLADDMSLTLRQRAFADYIGIRNYITPLRAIAYSICIFVFLSSIVIGVLAWISTHDIASVYGMSLLSIIPLSIGAALLLTQETSFFMPMKWKRAIEYVIVKMLLLFGILTAIYLYIGNYGLDAAIGVVLTFCIPSVALGTYLFLTEQQRLKPWARTYIKNEMKKFFANEDIEMRFGLMCGALWIGMASASLAIYIWNGLRFAWLPLPVAIIGTMLMLTRLGRKD